MLSFNELDGIPETSMLTSLRDKILSILADYASLPQNMSLLIDKAGELLKSTDADTRKRGDELISRADAIRTKARTKIDEVITFSLEFSDFKTKVEQIPAVKDAIDKGLTVASVVSLVLSGKLPGNTYADYIKPTADFVAQTAGVLNDFRKLDNEAAQLSADVQANYDAAKAGEKLPAMDISFPGWAKTGIAVAAMGIAGFMTLSGSRKKRK